MNLGVGRFPRGANLLNAVLALSCQVMATLRVAAAMMMMAFPVFRAVMLPMMPVMMVVVVGAVVAGAMSGGHGRRKPTRLKVMLFQHLVHSPLSCIKARLHEGCRQPHLVSQILDSPEKA